MITSTRLLIVLFIIFTLYTLRNGTLLHVSEQTVVFKGFRLGEAAFAIAGNNHFTASLVDLQGHNGIIHLSNNRVGILAFILTSGVRVTIVVDGEEMESKRAVPDLEGDIYFTVF
jgi:hypothetical protein